MALDPLLLSLLQDFVDEGLTLAHEVGAAVLELEAAWEEDQPGEPHLRQIQAALHTIKGDSAMIGLAPIETLAHALEDVCAFVGKQASPPGRREVELLLEGGDLLVGLIRQAASTEGAVDGTATQAFVRKIAEVLGPGGPAPALPAREARERSDKPAQPAVGVAGSDDDATSIRVEHDTIDLLMELAAETVVSHTELRRLQSLASRRSLNQADRAALDTVVSALGRTSSRLREELLSLRLMPVSSLFVRFRRYVRDLARDRGQPIRLSVEGAETTVDRAVLSRLHEPLMHLVRNAVAHGLERPEERESRGKPAEANLLLAAKLISGRVRIAVVDDGRGLNLEAIAAKASAIGVRTEGLGQDELRRLIFIPGLSTAAQITNLAGRGVGLDVVAEVVHGLGGSIDVESVPGEGTAFLLNLPATISQLKALLVSIDGELYAVPLGFLLESVRLAPGDLHEIGAFSVLPWRGELVPVIDGGLLLETGRPPSASRAYCVIIAAGNRRRGVLVDSLIKGQEVIVKPLGEALGPVRVIFGLSLLGDGRIAPILDCAFILGQGPRAPEISPDLARRTGSMAV
jgi:two-component system chemotaxis sensor kinase CheA